MQLKVSVIIPFYNNLSLLKKSIKSVLNQTFKSFEIIIIYDGGDKSNIKYLKNLNAKYSKIKIIYNKKNIGAGLSRNKGIKISKGKYIAFLDSDDTWKKNKLSSQISLMEKSKYSATHTSFNIIDYEGNYLSKREANDLDYNKLLNSCDIGLSTVVLKKNIINKMNNPFPPLKTKEDYVLWLRLSKRGLIFYSLKKHLTNWKNTPNSLSKSVYQKLKDAISVYKDYVKMSLSRSIIQTLILSTNFLIKK